MATLVIGTNFTAGTVAKASEVNGNFSNIVSWSTTLDVDNFATLTGELDFLVGTTKAVKITNTGTQPSIEVLSNGNSTGLVITDTGTNSSVTVTKSGQLAAGKAIILITDAVAQVNATAAVLKMALSSSATIPAVDIAHGSDVTFKLTKTQANLVTGSSALDGLVVNSSHLTIPSRTTVQKDALVAPLEGSIIYDSTSQELQVKNSTSWISSSSSLTGTIQTYAGFIIPTGWLLCDDTPASRTTYAALFAVLSKSSTGNTASGSPTISVIPANGTDNIAAGWFISGPGIQAGTTVVGTTSSTITLSQNATANGTAVPFTAAPYGIGNGTTTFNVPDMRRRVIMGSGGTATATIGNLLGNVGGSETHTLSLTEIPAHNHGGSTSSNTVNYTKGSSSYILNGYAMTSSNTGYGDAILMGTAHSHTISSAGGGATHNNIQSAIVLNYIIKT